VHARAGIAVLVTPLTALRSIGALGSLAIFSMASILVLVSGSSCPRK
jgi:hypothetical protein